MSIYTEEEHAERQRQRDEIMKDAPRVGDVVKVTDEHGRVHNGLVTIAHGPKCINTVYVSHDESKRDPNGRQIERMSSLQEKGDYTAPGGRFYEKV